MLRRHPILSALLLVALLGIGLVAYALATFDLNRYRGDLQSRLSAALELPVRLGRAELTLRRGPAVSFSELAVGEPGEEIVRAERLLVRLDWRRLFAGRLAFSRILLVKPHFRVLLTPEKKPFLWPDFGTLESAEIRSLAVREGIFRLEDRRDPRRPFSVVLEDIKAEISGIGAGKSPWISLGGNLRTGNRISPLTLAGEVTLPGGSKKEKSRVKLGAIVERFDPSPFLVHALARPRPPLSGAGRLELTVEGVPSGELRVQSRFTGSHLAAHIPGKKEPLRVRAVQGSAAWSRTRDGHALRALTLRADDLALAGEIVLKTEEKGGPWVEARLSTPSLPVRSVLRLLPGQKHAVVAGGTVQLHRLSFAGPVAALKDPQKWGGHLSADALLDNLSGEVAKVGKISQLSTRLRLKDDLLLLEGGKGEVLGTSVSFAGAVERPFAADREIVLEGEGAPAAERLLAYLPPERRPPLSVKGTMPAALGVSGAKERLHIDLRADLGAVALAWKDDFRKPAGTPATLFLTGSIAPERMELATARLRLPSLELLAHGSQERGTPAGYTLSLDLKASDLASARSFAPLLAELKAEGGVSAHLELSGPADRLGYRGTVTLHDAGFHMGEVVADLRQANGILRLSEERVDIERLSARLGTSPVSVEGHLAGFDDPRIELRVRARAIRADELVFTSPKALLRDVDAKLVIDRRHVAFAPVKVRLDGGTRAVVEGEVRNFDRPHVALDVAASEADIDEVIALWDPPESTSPAGSQEDEIDVTVRITARAEDGKLGPLRFQEATGVVSWERGILSVYPLRFRSGPGTCTGRVVVADRPGGYRLSVSGHAEKFDASSIYQELLGRRGLVTGALKGDFFLEGDLEEFSRTVKGGVNVEIEKGVLRKFSSLAKVFSLLNVSQIFTLQLPDMARDGMPFNRLSATFDVERGVLRTEDLFIDSNAMNLSLVGSLDLKTEELDMLLGLKPLRTVDKIVTRIPVAGWLLTGEEKALITAHFQIRGNADDPEVRAVPITSISEKAVGIFRRVLGLPGRLVDNVGEMVRGN